MEPLTLILRREGQFDRTDTIPCLASSCRHERTIMKIIPPKIDATLKSMKRTLHEKPALIPLTPDAPATFEGSLQPGHAIRDEAKFIQKRPSNVTNRSMERASIIFRSYASGFLHSQNIQNSEQKYPNNVDEVPIQAGTVKKTVLYRGDFPRKRPD